MGKRPKAGAKVGRGGRTRVTVALIKKSRARVAVLNKRMAKARTRVKVAMPRRRVR